MRKHTKDIETTKNFDLFLDEILNEHSQVHGKNITNVCNWCSWDCIKRGEVLFTDLRPTRAALCEFKKRVAAKMPMGAKYKFKHETKQTRHIKHPFRNIFVIIKN
ncbi:MAG: hypothetical protein KF900_14065 [Bacteroidetes bacterium]|nr:hypothetical protein [Bacteroidota bacterium]